VAWKRQQLFGLSASLSKLRLSSTPGELSHGSVLSRLVFDASDPQPYSAPSVRKPRVAFGF